MFSISMFMHIHWHFLKGSFTVPGSHMAHKPDFLEKSALFVAVSTCVFKGALILLPTDSESETQAGLQSV